MFANPSLSVLEDENLQGKKTIFTIFFAMKFFEKYTENWKLFN